MSTYFGISDGMSVGTLFSSLNSSQTSALSQTSLSGTASLLSQYSSIRNGSYGKLLTAYYKKYGTDADTSKSTSTSADTTKKLTSLKSTASDMQDSADKLLKTGTDSLFNKKSVTDEEGKTSKVYDMDGIYKAVKNFTQDYNALVESADDSKTSSIAKSADNMISTTDSNEKLLNSIGITVKADNTLSIDEEAFKKADVSAIKSLFNDKGGYGYTIKAYSASIQYNAGVEANRANTYTSSGSYSNTYSAGDLYNSVY